MARMTNLMANAIAVATERNMAHSTPLHSTTVLPFCLSVFEIAPHASLQSVRGRILATQTRPMDATTGIRGGL